MRRGFSLLSLALLLLAAAHLSAQTRERVKVSNVRLGLPPSRGGVNLYKAGQWAPVYFDLECVRDIDPPENLIVIVETKDADETITEGQVEISGLKLKGDQLRSVELGRVPYLKPGSTYSSSVVVRIKGKDSGKNFGESSDKTFSSIKTASFVLLGIGTNLNGLKFNSVVGADDTSKGGWIQTAQILEVGLMPDHWIGYGAVDLVILGTGGDRDFWIKLSEQQNEKRRQALAEWVRRGGRLIVSFGLNPDLPDALKEIKDMLPATIGAKRAARGLPFEWENASNGRTGAIRFGGNAVGEFPVVTLQPRADRATKVIVTEGESATRRPIAIQGPFGLGRVTVFSFDLDRAPFTDWSGRAAFWDNTVNQCGYQLPQSGKLDDNYNTRYDEFSSGLQGSLDYFEGVPVVSFGWVALFILIYIILIGPVDYLFLKKVIRRLEWTWVTFPVIVITVSAGAYFAAYALKGKDLKTNKVDIVDIDLAGKRIDGNAWFTLFSPRIQNYTIGVEPAGPIDGDTSVPSWTPANPSDAAHDTVISWQSNVERNRLGSGGGGLFTRRYKYQSETDPNDPNRELYASGLEGVPIQVWTTKAFHAQWSAPLDPAKPPIIADLSSVSRSNENILVGSITNNLPVGEFTDIVLFWQGKAFTLQDFPIGVSKAISFAAGQGSSEQDVKTWVTSDKRYSQGRPWTPQTLQTDRYGNEVGTTTNPNFRLWPVMFADFATETIRAQAPNASLRRIDQSWRVEKDRPEQAMLVLRTATREGQAEDISRSPDSPSRLWLGKLPTAGGKRPAMQGTLKQETYIRVFIPVKMPANPKR
jgi:hypothetical protein